MGLVCVQSANPFVVFANEHPERRRASHVSQSVVEAYQTRLRVVRARRQEGIGEGSATGLLGVIVSDFPRCNCTGWHLVALAKAENAGDDDGGSPA